MEGVNTAFEGLEEGGVPLAAPKPAKRKKAAAAKKTKKATEAKHAPKEDRPAPPPVPVFVAPKADTKKKKARKNALSLVKPKPVKKRKTTQAAAAAFTASPLSRTPSSSFQMPASPSVPLNLRGSKAKAPKALTGKSKSIALHKELSKDVTYKTLRAYFRNKQIMTILHKEGCKATPDQLRRLSAHERELLLVQVEEALDLATHTSVADTASQNLLSTLEQMVHNNTRFKIGGTTEKCFADKHWSLLYERAKIKNGIGLDPFDPLAELAIKTYSIAMGKHSENVISGHGVDLSAPAPVV